MAAFCKTFPKSLRLEYFGFQLVATRFCVGMLNYNCEDLEIFYFYSELFCVIFSVHSEYAKVPAQIVSMVVFAISVCVMMLRM